MKQPAPDPSPEAQHPASSLVIYLFDHILLIYLRNLKMFPFYEGIVYNLVFEIGWICWLCRIKLISIPILLSLSGHFERKLENKGGGIKIQKMVHAALK